MSFIGNPRRHFQHYAGRMNDPRREQRRWRAWASWAIARKVMPGLPGDPRHVVDEPSLDEISCPPEATRNPREAGLWHEALSGVRQPAGKVASPA